MFVLRAQMWRPNPVLPERNFGQLRDCHAQYFLYSAQARFPGACVGFRNLLKEVAAKRVIHVAGGSPFRLPYQLWDRVYKVNRLKKTGDLPKTQVSAYVLKVSPTQSRYI